MSFSLTGAPATDLCTSNLVVKDSVSATSTTSLNVNTLSINTRSTQSYIQPILSVFTGANLGSVVVKNGYISVYLLGQLNQSGAMLPAGTVFAYVPNYDNLEEITMCGISYNPDAATIATAGFISDIILHTNGTLTIKQDYDVATMHHDYVPNKNHKGGGMSVE